MQCDEKNVELTLWDFSVQQCGELRVLVERYVQLFLQIALHLPVAGLFCFELRAQTVNLSLHLVMAGCQRHLEKTRKKRIR